MVTYSGVPSRTRVNVVAPAVLVAAGGAVAAVCGAALGAIGALSDPLVVCAVATSAALALLAGMARSRSPWQVDVETPSSWLEYHDWRTVALNGVALGVGFVSRIGYWAWYVLPIGVLAFGDVLVGAVVFGTYATSRLVLSAYVTARLRPGCLTARQAGLAAVLDPLTCLSLGLVVAAAWVTVSQT